MFNVPISQSTNLLNHQSSNSLIQSQYKVENVTDADAGNC